MQFWSQPATGNELMMSQVQDGTASQAAERDGRASWLALETLGTKWRRGDVPSANLFWFIIVF